MTKHMNRTPQDSEGAKKRRNPGISAEDEWSHITGIEPKVESDPMLAEDRTIYFTNKFGRPRTREEMARIRAEELKGQVNETDQYVKFVNEMLNEKLARIKQIKQEERRFLDELSVLQNKIKSREEINKVNPKYATDGDVASLISHLEAEYERMKEKLLYQELIVQKTKDEIAKKKNQIQKLVHDAKAPPKPKGEDPLTILRDELKKLGLNESSKIFKTVDEISKMLDSKGD